MPTEMTNKLTNSQSVNFTSKRGLATSFLFNFDNTLTT